MSADSITAQAILDGKWTHAAKARKACLAGAWSAFVEEVAPPSPVIVGRFDLSACRRLAADTFAGPREATVTLVPTWVGDNPDEDVAASWYVGHVMGVDDEPLRVVENGPRDSDAAPAVDRFIACKANVWRVAHVVLTRNYSPEIPLLLRRGDYGVIAAEVIEVVSAEVATGAALPRPNASIPPFCVWLEPRVDGLSPAMVQAIRDLSITVDEDGNFTPQAH
jgi:hypothetical protein